GPGHGRDRPRDQRQRKGKHYRAEPACRYRGRQERQGHEPVEREPGKHRERPRDWRPDNDIRGICRVSHGRSAEPPLLGRLAPKMYRADYRAAVPPKCVGGSIFGPYLAAIASTAARTSAGLGSASTG